MRIEADRLTTRNIDALPDIIRIAKANGWTSIKLSGGDKFKKAAYLAATAQGLPIENYTPTKVVQAEADHLTPKLHHVLGHHRNIAAMARKLPQTSRRPKMN